MDGGGSALSPDEKAAERLMDEHLKSLGLHRKKVAKDGSCLFRAVAEQVLHCQSLHTRVRAQCVDFLQQNRESYEAFIEGDFVDYLDKLQDPQQWVGEVEINALAVMYKKDFLIFQEPGKPPVNITDNNFKDKVRLCFLNGNHYDSVYPISHVKNAALCQSILYELLYDDVFKVDRSLLGACQRVSRPSDVLSDDNMAACGSSDESDLDGSEALWVENGANVTTTRHTRGRGRGRQLLPERVRRSLNPTLFRNIEYDVWHKTKRAQQKMDYCIAAGMQFTVGDRCQVRLEGSGRTYNATIKEVLPNSGPVTVYIEELGKKQVPLWSLRPPSEEGSWSTVVNRDKRLSNGHGDWEDRGRGRGRGKHVPASSSVSQATGPGSSGRVLKQHSWPPQATVDEQSGAKANRSLKSVSSVETSFGLTEQQRLAKEEEERNVALVEIQLRDEHSFPALGTQPGTQSDGGKKKGGEKKRSQRNKTKSPVEDVRASSPSPAERPKSSTPPLTSTAAVNTAPPADSSPPAAKPPANSDSNPALLSSLKAASSASSTPTPKTSAPSYTLATGTTPCSLPAAAPTTKPPVTGGAVPPSVPSSASVFSFLTPVLPAASSPPTSHALSSSSPPPSSSSKLSSLPPQSSASPPPSSSLPPPTFIAPIAPSPNASHGFLLRSSPPVSTLTHSPSPPPSSAHEAPPVSGQTPNSLPNIGATVTASQSFQSQTSLSQLLPQVSQVNHSHVSVTQTSSIQVENQTKLSPPVNQILMPQTQTESCLPALHQHQPQSSTDVVSLPQNQRQVSLTQVENQTQSFLPANQTLVPQMQTEAPSSLQHQSQVQYPLPAVAEVQSSHPAPGASYPLTSQASVPASMQPHPHLHAPPAQPPHPSQVPHPPLSLSSPTHPNAQNPTEGPLPPAQQTQRQTDSPAQPPSQQSHVPHPALYPLLQSAHPPHPQSIPAVSLQQLSQIYQDPLYPGFAQGEKGDVAPIPPMSSSKSGDDLPQDINIMRFFFNLGIKAYSMPMFPPYFYLLPLQQAHTLHPKLPSRSPSPTPHYLSSNTPTRHQEAYPHSQYPPTSASVPSQYDHQVPLTEPSHPSEPSFNQAAYPATQPPPNRMSGPGQWQQHQMPPPRNTSFPAEYSTPNPPYPLPPPLSQGYPPGQVPGHPMYRPSMPPYPPPSLGYQPSSTPEELQVNQGLMEQRQPANGDTILGQRPSRVTGPAANANNNRTVVVPGVGLKKEPGDSLTKVVLLVDPPLNPDNPILVSNPAIKDVPVSMTAVKTSSTPASPLPYDIISKTTIPSDNNPSRGYRGHQKPHHPTSTYVPLGAPETSQVSYLTTVSMAEGLSVGCSTEDDWEEQTGFKPTTLTHRGTKRSYRGGGGRGSRGHDPGRGSNRRRYEGEPGAGFRYVQYSSSHRGRGRERGY